MRFAACQIQTSKIGNTKQKQTNKKRGFSRTTIATLDRNMTEERTCLHQQASELKQFQSRLSITSARDPLVAQPALLQWCQHCKKRKEKINIRVQQIFISPELSSVLCVSPVIKMPLKTACKLTAVRSLVEHCCCIATSPFPLLSHPEFRTVAG